MRTVTLNTNHLHPDNLLARLAPRISYGLRNMAYGSTHGHPKQSLFHSESMADLVILLFLMEWLRNL